MIDLSKFKAFDFTEGVPYVSITNNGLTFNKSVIMKMGYPEKVKLLINAEEKQFAVQICDENDDKAVKFYRETKSGVLSVRWNARDLINTVSRIMGWDLSSVSYRVDGVYMPELELMLFDMKDAKALD